MKAHVVFDDAMTERRLEYATAVDGMRGISLWFLDESGFNLHLAPMRSWSERGRTPVQPVPANRQQNVSLLMCISEDGVMGFELNDGAFNANSFTVFLANLAVRHPAVKTDQVCVVMDNARIHHANDVREFCRQKNITVMFLPPHTPELNPIENVFGVLKRRFRALGVVATRDQMKERIRGLIRDMDNNDDIRPFYRRMETFIQKAMARESFF